MSTPLRLGIAGLGTVGAGVVKIVQAHGDLLAARAGRPVEIAAVSARNRTKRRGVDLSAYAWLDDPVALAARPDVDVVVELMGGSDGPAKAATEAALKAGKDVVTANKAMLAVHGQTLAELAESRSCALRYEAAVAGGIPVVKALAEGLAGNEISRVMGVMNGTCNYILTRMESAGLTYEEVFEEARSLGYLEADPTLDVGGIDGLLHISNISWGRVNHPSEALDEGQEIVVQVAKDPIGTKGARLTTHIALPGRYLVFMPTVEHVGISRRIEKDRERRRLRDFVEKNRRKGAGYIVRTVSVSPTRWLCAQIPQAIWNSASPLPPISRHSFMARS